MVIAKQMEIRSDIKKYFDMAFEGETIIVPRKQSKNVVIISESEYNRLNTRERLYSYAKKLSEKPENSVFDNSSIKNENLKKLDAIMSLKNNWNGNGSPSFPKVLISKVRRLIEGLPIQPEIFPTALQTIQLEYENARRDHMEIEISTGNTASVFIVLSTGSETEETIPSNLKSIKERILFFYG